MQLATSVFRPRFAGRRSGIQVKSGLGLHKSPGQIRITSKCNSTLAQHAAMTFRDRNQVEAYVEGALREGTPEGWAFERSSKTRLWWTIRRVSIPPGEWGWQDYHLHVTDDLHWFMLTYGNNDIGLGSLPQELQTARVISAISLRVYSLADCIRHHALQAQRMGIYLKGEPNQRPGVDAGSLRFLRGGFRGVGQEADFGGPPGNRKRARPRPITCSISGANASAT